MPSPRVGVPRQYAHTRSGAGAIRDRTSPLMAATIIAVLSGSYNLVPSTIRERIWQLPDVYSHDEVPIARRATNDGRSTMTGRTSHIIAATLLAVLQAPGFTPPERFGRQLLGGKSAVSRDSNPPQHASERRHHVSNARAAFARQHVHHGGVNLSERPILGRPQPGVPFDSTRPVRTELF
jgi:hypothetical protein